MKLTFGKVTFLLLFIIIIGTLFTGCGMRYIMNSTKTLKKEDAKEFTVEKEKVVTITKIDINTGVADVEIIPADDYYVEIDYTYWEKAPEYSIEDGVLSYDDSNSFPNSYSLNFDLDNSIKIYLPAEASLDQIKMENSSGDVSASGFVTDKLNVNVAYGNLTLENAMAAESDIRLSSGTSKITDFSTGKMVFTNSYGNAEFTNINTSGLQSPDNAASESFQISMSSGNIDINGLNSSSTEISNSYGDITCEEISSEKFDASLSSGDLKISKADLKDISVNNSYGDLTLSLNMTKADYSMDLKTSYGDIFVDGESYDDHLILENGGTRNIDADLSSGNININFNK